MRRKILPLLVTALIATATVPHVVADTSERSSTVQSSFSQAPWLRDVLPDNTLLYARIPSILTTISAKDDSFKAALANENYTQVIQQIKEAGAQWIKKSDEQIQPILSLLTSQLTSPIEIAAIANGPMPQVLVTASLDFKNSDELSSLIASLVKTEAVRGEKTPLSDGAGELITDLGPVPYRWESQKKQLNILISFGGASISQLDQVFSSLTANPENLMFLNEAKMDSSTQGLYLWFNNKVAYPIYQAMAPAHVKQQLTLLGVPDMQSLALSWGVRNEKGRIKLLVEAPQKGLIRELLPINNNELAVKTAGNPKVSMLISLPSEQEFTRIEKTVQSLSGPKQSYLDAKIMISDKLGFSIEDVLASVGPELIGVYDQAGEYSVIRIRDNEKWQGLLSTLKAKEGIEISTREINDKQITHMKLPSFIGENLLKDLKNIPFFVSELLTKGNTHLYWQQEGDYLILSTLPQVLSDRNLYLSNNSRVTNLQKWLEDTQKQDLTASTLAISGSVSDTPRKLYYAYLQALQFLADITGAKIDIASLPSAQQLNLATAGTLGLQLDSNEDSLGLEVTFESTPIEAILATQGLASAANIGMLAAIAIPAYQDYLFKSQLNIMMSDVSYAKTLVQQSLANTGQLPNAQKAIELNQQFAPNKKYELNIQPDSGNIIVHVFNKSTREINLQAEVIDGNLHWSCRSNLAYKHRPADCKKPL